MWKSGCVCLVVAVLVSLFGASNATASPGNWLDEPIVRSSEVPGTAPSIGDRGCSGHIGYIQLSSTPGYAAACVYGVPGKLRVARYSVPDHQYVYAVSLKSDHYFHELRGFCVDIWRCAYSQSEDVMMTQELLETNSLGHFRITSFSQHIRPVAGQKGVYEVNTRGDVIMGQTTATSSFTLSSNGRWALIEVYRRGIVRLDVRSGVYSWIISLYTGSGPVPQPVGGMAISNDGQWVSTVGWVNGFTMYRVTESCSKFHGLFEGVTNWCPSSSVHKDQLLPGYVRAYMPVISHDGMRVSILLVTQGSVITRVTLTPQSQAQASSRYMAFGDSYSSGEGELEDAYYQTGTNTKDNRCHVSRRSYPYILGGRIGLDAHNAACSGSRIPDVRAAHSKTLSTEQASVSLVTLGIGGNDIDLIGKLRSCLGPGTCEWAKVQVRSSLAKEMQKLLPDLAALIDELRIASGSSVVVIGYPLVMNSDDTAQCDLVIGSLLNSDERVLLQESIRYLNLVLQEAARVTGSAYVDIEDALSGERLCEGSQKAMNGVRWGDDIAVVGSVKVIGAESFHPTPFGHERIAGRIAGEVSSVADPPGAPSLFTPEYWLRGGPIDAAPLLKAWQFIETHVVPAGSGVPIEFNEGSLEPGSSVTVSLWSEPQHIGTYVVGMDGSFREHVTLPPELAGYHSLHVETTTASGEAVNLYQSLYLDGGRVDDASVEVSVPPPFQPRLHYDVPEVARAGHAHPVQGATSVLGHTSMRAETEASGRERLVPQNRWRLLVIITVTLVVALLATVLFIRKV